PEKTLPLNPQTGCEFNMEILPDAKKFRIEYLNLAFSLPIWFIEQLLAQFGYEKTLGVCFASNRKPSVYARPNKLKTTAEKLCEIFKAEKIDKVMHLAALAGVRNSLLDPIGYEDVNVRGTLNLLEMARRYKIKNPHAISDFDRLDEAIIRRLKNTTWPKPDLIIIDGGVPQLRRLQRIFDRETNPPFYLGLAKHPDRLIVPNNNIGQPDFLTLKLSSTHPALQLLEQLRDEAHRFANSYRKILEKKRTRI
ncbi:MAG: Excinuclease ABC C subunit domain protein, partial [Microgenomates group bacterium GW2011_GWC2_46_7]